MINLDYKKIVQKTLNANSKSINDSQFKSMLKEIEEIKMDNSSKINKRKSR